MYKLRCECGLGWFTAKKINNLHEKVECTACFSRVPALVVNMMVASKNFNDEEKMEQSNE